MDILENKARLFFSLHSNDCDSSLAALQEKECIKCRARHDGICNIQYHKGEIICNLRNGQIIDFCLRGRFTKE
jgi:hypothetical protein